MVSFYSIYGQFPDDLAEIAAQYREALADGMVYEGAWLQPTGELFIRLRLAADAPVEPPDDQPPTPEGVLLSPPPELDTPVTVTLTNKDRSPSLDPNKDYILRFGEVLTGVTFIEGGRNVVLIGGEIRIDAPSGEITPRTGLKIKKRGTGTVFIEGCWLHGEHLSEGIQVDAEDADIVIQNCRIECVDPDNNHTDVIQTYGGYKSLRVYNLTGTSPYQGLLLKSDHVGEPALDTHIERMNIIGLPGARYLLWIDASAGKSRGAYTFVDTYCEPHAEGNRMQRTVWLGGNIDDDLFAQVDGRWFVPLPDPRVTSGSRVAFGKPPGGDFVPSGTAGMAYKSPGYAAKDDGK